MAALPAVTIEDVEKAIRSFPRGSAAGLTGLRPQHLKDALVPGHEDEVLRQAAGVVEILARGEAASAVRVWLCGGSLTALPKNDGGLRPILIGETLRRVVGKVLSASTRDEMQQYLEPLQLGVGTKACCETIIHVVRQWLGRNEGDLDRALVTGLQFVP